jgi:hypothetical protein
MNKTSLNKFENKENIFKQIFICFLLPLILTISVIIIAPLLPFLPELIIIKITDIFIFIFNFLIKPFSFIFNPLILLLNFISYHCISPLIKVLQNGYESFF